MTVPASFVTIYGQHAGDAIFEDESGMARVPLRAIGVLSHSAAVTRAHRATWDGRTFDRDVLAAVRRDWENDDLPDLDTCATTGCDEAAPFLLAHARPACSHHAKEMTP